MYGNVLGFSPLDIYEQRVKEGILNADSNQINVVKRLSDLSQITHRYEPPTKSFISQVCSVCCSVVSAASVYVVLFNVITQRTQPADW